MVKKILLSVIAILFLLGGGIVYYIRQDQPENVTSPLQDTPTPLPVSPTLSVLKEDTQSINKVIPAFYASYLSCLKNPPVAARGKVSVYCQSEIGEATKAFVANLKAGGTARFADPITCSQNPPTEVTVDTVDFETPDQGTATTVVTFGGGFAQKIPVIVVKEAGMWKVDMVSCPRT